MYPPRRVAMTKCWRDMHVFVLFKPQGSANFHGIGLQSNTFGLPHTLTSWRAIQWDVLAIRGKTHDNPGPNQLWPGFTIANHALNLSWDRSSWVVVWTTGLEITSKNTALSTDNPLWTKLLRKVQSLHVSLRKPFPLYGRNFLCDTFSNRPASSHKFVLWRG